jgi:hypothetical protein
MKMRMKNRSSLALLAALATASMAGSSTLPATQPTMQPTTQPIDGDDFQHGTRRWIAEFEHGGTATAKDGTLDLDVPAGATLWFDREFSGPLIIEYEATIVSAGGPNDRVSDLNCFWMATDARSPADLFATKRSGAFADYNPLLTYYVGFGGNENTTTRFRRYIGSATTRPLEPAHDLRDAKDLLVANRPYQIRLVADGRLIQYWRDGEKVFELVDEKPYTRGYFALRTVKSHLRIRDFKVSAISRTPASPRERRAAQ